MDIFQAATSPISIPVRYPLLLYRVNPSHYSDGSGKQSKGLLRAEESGLYKRLFAFAYTCRQL